MKLCRHPGTKIGYFAQEPDLGSAKTVIDAVNEGVDIRGLVKEFEDVSKKLGEPLADDEMTRVLGEASRAARQDRRHRRLEF